MKNCILTQLLVWFLRDSDNFFVLFCYGSIVLMAYVRVRCVYVNGDKVDIF